jgi:hypothetical protein
LEKRLGSASEDVVEKGRKHLEMKKHRKKKEIRYRRRSII